MPELGTDYPRHALEQLHKEGVSNHFAVAIVENVIAGRLKPESAISFGRAINGTVELNADQDYHRRMVDTWLDDPSFAGFRAAPPAPEKAPEPPPPAWRPEHGGMGLPGSPRQPDPNAPPPAPGSVEASAAAMRDRQAAGQQVLRDRTAQMHAQFNFQNGTGARPAGGSLAEYLNGKLSMTQGSMGLTGTRRPKS